MLMGGQLITGERRRDVHVLEGATSSGGQRTTCVMVNCVSVFVYCTVYCVLYLYTVLCGLEIEIVNAGLSIIIP